MQQDDVWFVVVGVGVVGVAAADLVQVHARGDLDVEGGDLGGDGEVREF